MKKLFVSVFITAFVFSAMSFADVRLPSVIGENMVVQSNAKINIWGWADPGESVTVSFAGQEGTSLADNSGKWKVVFSQIKPGGPYEMTVRGKNLIKFNNILAGEVWVCSGQSNMELSVQHTENAPLEISGSYNPMIRVFSVKNDVSDIPKNNCEGKWEVCRPSTISAFSAVGYYFGKFLNGDLNTPVGLINSSWGGSGAEAWTPSEVFKNDATLTHITDMWAPILKSKTPELLDFYRKNGEWVEDVYYADVLGKAYQPYYNLPSDINFPALTPKALFAFPLMPAWTYNAMINPLIPFTIKGVIWYQGETNADRAYEYRRLFPAMIKGWRDKWSEGDFPFIYTQLAGFKNFTGDGAWVDGSWPELREAQLMTLSMPRTAMAVTMDIGHPTDIHPRNKKEAARRLEIAALNVAYGKNNEYSGPMYKSMNIDNGKIQLDFTHTGSGLIAKDSGELKGFSIAGKDMMFVPAKASIDGNRVIVTSEKIKEPTAVRYGWEHYSDCNLFNKEGLPASPFRTDDAPGVTINK